MRRTGRRRILWVEGLTGGGVEAAAERNLLDELIGPLQTMGGWTAVWYFLIACVVTGTALMGPKIWKELTSHN